MLKKFNFSEEENSLFLLKMISNSKDYLEQIKPYLIELCKAYILEWSNINIDDFELYKQK